MQAETAVGTEPRFAGKTVLNLVKTQYKPKRLLRRFACGCLCRSDQCCKNSIQAEAAVETSSSRLAIFTLIFLVKTQCKPKRLLGLVVES